MCVPEKCEKCGASFATRSSKKRHLKKNSCKFKTFVSKIDEGSENTCKICLRTFSTKGNLERHGKLNNCGPKDSEGLNSPQQHTREVCFDKAISDIIKTI